MFNHVMCWTLMSTHSNVQVELELLPLQEPQWPGWWMATMVPYKWWARAGPAKEGTTGGGRGLRHNTSWAPWYIFLLSFFTFLIFTKCFFLHLDYFNDHGHHRTPSPSLEWTQARGAAASWVLGEGLRHHHLLSPCQVCFFLIMFFYFALNNYLAYVQNKYNHHNDHQPVGREERVWAQDMPAKHHHHTTNSSAWHASDACQACKLVKKNLFLFLVLLMVFFLSTDSNHVMAGARDATHLEPLVCFFLCFLLFFFSSFLFY